MTEERSPSILRRILGGIWWLIKLIIVLAVIAALVVAAYVAYTGLVAPIASNTAAINALRADLDTSQDQINAQLRALQENIVQLEVPLRDQGSRLAELEVTEQDRGAALQSLRELLDAQVEAMTRLESAIEELQQEVPATRSDLTRLKLNALLLKAAGQVLRARVRLMENNPGDAQRELELARATLEQMGELGGEAAQETVALILERLDRAYQSIEDNPFNAPGEVELLWRAINDAIGF